MKNRIKKLELDKNLEIEMLEKQLADCKNYNSQLQSDLNYFRNTYDYRRDKLEQLESMNLFQLILWKLKQ